MDERVWKILVYKEKEYFIARCLENNLVAQASNLGELQSGIVSLFLAQIELDEMKGRKAFSTNKPAKAVYHTIFSKAAKFRFPEDTDLSAELALAIQFMNPEWSDIFIDLSEEFGVTSSEFKKDIWLLEKPYENLDRPYRICLSERVTLNILYSICDEFRLPREFFVMKYKLPPETPQPEPIEESEL